MNVTSKFEISSVAINPRLRIFLQVIEKQEWAKANSCPDSTCDLLEVPKIVAASGSNHQCLVAIFIWVCGGSEVEAIDFHSDDDVGPEILAS